MRITCFEGEMFVDHVGEGNVSCGVVCSVSLFVILLSQLSQHLLSAQPAAGLSGFDKLITGRKGSSNLCITN